MISSCCKRTILKCKGTYYCDECQNKCEIEQAPPLESTTSDQPIKSSGRDLRRETEEWLTKNQKAWELFKEFALAKAHQGRKFGIKALAERVRWEEPVATDGSVFKVPNSYIAYIARKLIETYPSMKKYIELRKTKW